jgi:hypothetical protein
MNPTTKHTPTRSRRSRGSTPRCRRERSGQATTYGRLTRPMVVSRRSRSSRRTGLGSPWRSLEESADG